MDVSIQNEGLFIPRFHSGDMLMLVLYEDSYESFFKPRLVSPCLGQLDCF